MDLKKAMDEVDGMVGSYMFDKCIGNDGQEAIDTVLKACEKQIPKAVKVMYQYETCPVGKKIVGSKAKYCKECGQRVVREE